MTAITLERMLLIMKKLIALLLAMSICILCAACGSDDPSETMGEPVLNDPETTAPVTEATEPATEAVTEAPTEEVTEPVTEATEPPALYTNPLTGEALDAPSEIRIVAVTVNNVPDALPHRGVNQADLFFEMFVNDGATRGLALYNDITEAETIGSIRSTRYNFTDIAQSYDAFLAHAGGSNQVLSDLKKAGVPNFNIDVQNRAYYAFRDTGRKSSGYAWEHCLFTTGAGLCELMQKKEWTDRDPEKTYGLCFTQDGTPVNGEDANQINITFKLGKAKKTSTLTYSQEDGQYIYTQYGNGVKDVGEDYWEYFENVFVIMTNVQNSGVYHVADLIGSGDGYYACGGKIIPIRWSRETDTSPFIYTHTDGTQLEQGIGSSYIAIVPLQSTVAYQ